jgi:hypothetical protein
MGVDREGAERHLLSDPAVGEALGYQGQDASLMRRQPFRPARRNRGQGDVRH